MVLAVQASAESSKKRIFRQDMDLAQEDHMLCQKLLAVIGVETFVGKNLPSAGLAVGDIIFLLNYDEQYY